ncbi:nitroreductase [Streptomyces sp. HB132]|uniref:Acg family FMN-binding oxidoreductase n=1 Tax=Streptomyces sp. HB132 TaxID=767388 RepID=UPI00196177FC|nr:nitroreductase [Streptomyces sp. HB132]MBM7440249.1 nitroreductase [Streptomyces sp. HB132]
MPTRHADVAAVSAWIGDATMAPSMHNAQPWRFRYTPAVNVLDVRMDPTRSMPRTDPADRGMHISCGAALFNLRVAAAHAGWSARVRLLPDPADPGLAATAVFTEHDGTDTLATLYPAIARRHSSREPFTDESVPEALLDGLRGAARSEGASMSVLSDWQVDAVLDVVGEAEQNESLSPDVRDEIARWTGTGAGDSAGIPGYAFGPHRHDGRAPVRDFAVGRPDPGRASAVFERYPCLAVLGTSADRPQDWLLAGQALERVLLQATLDGLSTSLNSQAVESTELRWLLRDPRSSATSAFPQMLLRLGYGPLVPPTPRRAVSDVLDIERRTPY